MPEPQLYRQYSTRLRVQRGSGRPDLVSERPHTRRGNTIIYTDSDEHPTLVSFDEHCQVNVPFLLQVGALVEYVPPPEPEAAEEVG